MSLVEVTRIRPIYGDTDQMGVVYYANYLRYFEIARNEFLRSLGAEYRSLEQSHGLFLPVTEAHARYHRPSRYDDVLVLRTGIGNLGAASMRFDYAIARADADTVLVDGHTVHACVDRQGKVARLPPELRDKLVASGAPTP